MKKLIALIVFCLQFHFAVAANEDIVYLNNGQMVKGKITDLKENYSVTIKTSNGEFKYPMIEVNKIDQGDSKVNIPQAESDKDGYRDYMQMNSGFFFATEVGAGFSINREKSISFTELDLIGGYRFNEYIRVGLGFGPRLYTSGKSERNSYSRWSMPLFAAARGNFIPSQYRNVVPFWSFDMGTTFPDGFMFRPTAGIRVGQLRSAFTLSVGYLGQAIRQFKKDDDLTPRHNYYSFLVLKLGYEF